MSCAAPPASIPHSGSCQPPVKDCNHPSGLPELANHTYRNTPTASEDAFVNRYTKLGGKRRSRRAHRVPRRRRTSNYAKSKSSRMRKRRSRRTRKHRGGVGFRLDLSACPDGGIAHPLQYETKASSMDSGHLSSGGFGLRKRTVRRRVAKNAG